MNIQDDLTNLNWVAGSPALLRSLSPPREGRGAGRSRQPSAFFGSPKRTVIATTPERTKKVASTSVTSISNQTPPNNITPRRIETPKSSNTSERRPKCSYTCLIGMAMKANPESNGCLPVHEIYRYIEKEFPYFRTAPDGWKNSIRHNLSLNTSFRKVSRSDGWQGKKGHYWEMTPERKQAIDEEVQTFLRNEGRSLESQTPTSTSQSTDSLQKQSRKKSTSKSSSGKEDQPVKRKLEFSSKSKKTQTKSKPPSPPRPNTPTMVREYSKEIQEQLLNSDVSIVPTLSPTLTALDTNHAPSSYIGMDPPSNDPDNVANELFGLSESTQETSFNDSFRNQWEANAMVPYLAPAPYCGVFGFPYAPATFIPSNVPSPIVTPSPTLTPMGTPPFISSPQYMPYTPFSPYMGVLPGQPVFLSPPPPVLPLNTPVSVEILNSSEEMEIGQVIEIIEDNAFCDSQPKTSNNNGVNNDIPKQTHKKQQSKEKCNNIQNEQSQTRLDSVEEMDNSSEETLVTLEDLKNIFGPEYERMSESEIVSTLKFLNQLAKQHCMDTNDHDSQSEVVENFLDLYSPEFSSQNNCNVNNGQAISNEDSAPGPVPRLNSFLTLSDKNIESIEEGLKMNGESEVVRTSSMPGGY